jgi:hypothetical protein
MLCPSKNLYYVQDSNPFLLKKNTLPTNDEILRFYFSRDSRSNDNAEPSKSWSLGKTVEKLWNDADCCPMTARHIDNKINSLVSLFYQFKHKNRSHHSKKPKAKLAPTRKSKRVHQDEDPPLPPQVSDAEDISTESEDLEARDKSSPTLSLSP